MTDLILPSRASWFHSFLYIFSLVSIQLTVSRRILFDTYHQPHKRLLIRTYNSYLCFSQRLREYKRV